MIDQVFTGGTELVVSDDWAKSPDIEVGCHEAIDRSTLKTQALLQL